ncbi:MAG: asparagine synthase (glutamine-hydrolyzing) [Patescibacteria group bacterium]|nr:asparagine synthase (glutamine-hydrolyzing) [Patescibacteria group bacterium]
MCGIAGYFGQGDKETLIKMADSVKYRGPDDFGYYVNGSVGLCHRRLSIIDLSNAGKQPMHNEDSSVIIIFNGEIYNYRELRKKLSGHKFKSNTDTEVILHLFEEKGPEAFKEIAGMFALAIYDKLDNKLYLARDRMGKKPLYYSLVGKNLIFGSEIKSLLAHGIIRKELDLSSLNKYLQFEYIPTPNTIFQGVKKLKPGSFAVYDGNNFKINTFWNLEFRNYESQDIEKAINDLDKLLGKTIKQRLVSDVPLGVFLSGGIDSSTIAYYAQKNSLKKIKTFSIGFDEESFNESDYAKTVADYLGTEHHEQRVTADDMLGVIGGITDLLDEPLADASIIPTYILCRFTSEKVKVALSGDGGDELFCGYDTFLAHRGAELYEKIPLIFRKKIIEPIGNRLPISFNNISFDFAVKSFIKGFYGEKKYRDFRWLGSFDHGNRSKLLNHEIWSYIKGYNEYSEVDNYLSQIKSNDFYRQLIYLYLRMYLMDDILVKADRASMYNSLEVRSPFLDYKLVDLVNSFPTNYKIKQYKTKYILKKLMADKLPEKIIKRKKKGFGIPIAEWISGPLKPMVTDLLSQERIKKQNLFNPDYINYLLKQHFSRRQDNRKQIWTLLIFQIWQEKWLD